MRLAVGQPPPRNTVEGNAAAAAALVAQARALEARVLLLPELFLSGYQPQAVVADRERWAVTLDDPRLQPVVKAARECGVAVAMGAALREPVSDALRNAVLWFRSNGTVEHVYSKVHLWADERAVFTCGDRQAVVQLDDVRLGIGICYDAGFPEFVRSYARAGVDAVLFASAFAVGPEQHRYGVYHPARALENGIYVAVANCTGTLGAAEYFGRSQILDRQGQRMVDLAASETLGVAELTSDETDVVPYLADLRKTVCPPDRFEG